MRRELKCENKNNSNTTPCLQINRRRAESSPLREAAAWFGLNQLALHVYSGKGPARQALKQASNKATSEQPRLCSTDYWNWKGKKLRSPLQASITGKGREGDRKTCSEGLGGWWLLVRRWSVARGFISDKVPWFDPQIGDMICAEVILGMMCISREMHCI